MHFRTLSIVLAAFAWHGGTAAQSLEIVEHAYELTLGNMNLPASEVGTLIFKACDDCESKALRVATTTRYSISEAPVSLAELRDRVNDVQNGDAPGERTPVTVFYSTVSGNVTRISMHD